MKKTGLIFIIFFIIIYDIFADINDNAGNSTTQFLKIPPSIRIGSMGKSVSISGSVESMFYNPAGIGFLDHWEASLNYSKWLADMNYTSAGIGLPLKNIGTAGIGYLGLSSGDIPVVKIDHNNNLIASHNTSAQDLGFILSYGFSLKKNCAIGINGKLISESLDNEKSTVFAFDSGIIIKLINNRLSIGLAVQNIGPKVKFMQEKYQLPLNVQTGINYLLVKNNYHSLLVLSDISKANDDNLSYCTGAEYGLFDIFFGRASYQPVNDLGHFSIGGGIKVPIKSTMISINYAYLPFDSFNSVHMFGVIIK